MLVAAPLMVRHSRLLIDQRRYRIALDEVSNQLDRLSALPADELAAALEQIKVNDWTLARLPGCRARSAIWSQSDLGNRLTLELSYGAEANRLVQLPRCGGPEAKECHAGKLDRAL